MKQCPKCNSYMRFNMDYFCGNPFIYYNCISCGYGEREHLSYYISTTGTNSYFTDSYLENRLSELKKEYGGVNIDDTNIENEFSKNAIYWYGDRNKELDNNELDKEEVDYES